MPRLSPSRPELPISQSLAKRLDLRGLNCPLPVLRTAKALRKCAPGTLLRIECTDPLAGIDIPHFIATTPHVLESQTNDENTIVFFIRRGEGQ